MDPTGSFRPRVSRETRLLLTAAIVAMAVLWLLARVRFRDRPAPPSPIPAVLSQLTGGPKLDELASEIAATSGRVRPLVTLASGTAGGEAPRAPALTGLRIRDDVALAWLPSPSAVPPSALLALDRAAGIGLVRSPGVLPARPVAWRPAASPGARYVLATDVAGSTITLQPAFIAAFEPIRTALWPDPLWAVPRGSTLPAGSLLFTSSAELVGLVIAYGGGRAIVPGATVLAEAEALLASPTAAAGALGIEVQDLSPPLASATGAASGVVVSWVDPAGAAQERLRPGDVIESVDGRSVNARGDWDVITARLAPGRTVELRVRRAGAVQGLSLVATAATPAAPASAEGLGLTLQPRARMGAEVVALVPGAAGERAGLAPDDVITLIGDVPAPTPRQVTRAFAALAGGGRVLVAVTRGDTHFVTTLEKRP